MNTHTKTTGPDKCHYDRTLGQRVTNRHRDDCPSQTSDSGQCPAAGRGCQPCTAPHCILCSRTHATNDHPHTCPECIGVVRNDLADIQASYTALALEALEGGGDGRLVAAAPIPGGTAQVLIGPTVRLDVVRVSRTMRKDHRPKDPIPPLAVLAQWEDLYRAWLGHTHAGETRQIRTIDQVWLGRGPVRRASIASAIAYLTDQLPHIANRIDGTEPDWLAFTHQIRRLRAQLEHALHDEREPELGVSCFECGDSLVRRFVDPKRCRHSTPAREALKSWIQERRPSGQDWLRTLGTYPELGPPRREDHHAAAAPTASLIRAARVACSACTTTQGGIADPRPGRSWECPGCRKSYDVGEYATAVRRDLVDRHDGSSWCPLATAAEAASDISGRSISTATIRTWIERGDTIGVACEWKKGQRFGVQLVFWPDVIERATEVRGRGRRSARRLTGAA